MAERKFATFKIEAGDYILPGNDKITLWRICHGQEEEIAEDSETIITRPCWDLFKWYGRLTQAKVEDRVVDDLEDWDRWEMVEQGESMKELLARTAELVPGFDND